MNTTVKAKVHGFTLMELLVVVGILALLVSIVFASISEARKGTRDKRRVSDLANIEFALTLHKEKNRSYPSTGLNDPLVAYESGFGGPLDTITRAFNGSAYKDSMSTVANGEYGYWYFSKATCTQANQSIIIALQMEQAKNANFASVCTAASAADKLSFAKTYVVVLKQ